MNPKMMEIATVVAVDMMNMMTFPVPFFDKHCISLNGDYRLVLQPVGQPFITLV